MRSGARTAPVAGLASARNTVDPGVDLREVGKDKGPRAIPRASFRVGRSERAYSRVEPNRCRSIMNMLMKLRYRLSAPMIALRVATSAASSS